MYKFLIKRILASIPVLLGVVSLVFILIHLIPGDPVELILGDSAQLLDKEQLRATLGLDKPLSVQYFLFWKQIFFESWGRSLSFNQDVLSLIMERFPSTVLLSFSALLTSIALSFPLGVFAASRARTLWDTGATVFSLLGMTVPLFVLAPLCILIFSIYLGWLPVSGSGTLWHLILPSLCLGFGLSGILTRMIRTSMLENLSEDYIRTARAKGLSEYKVLFHHALKNALIPVITLLGNMLGGLLAGAVITETLFDWPGIGKLFFTAFRSRDYPLVQGIVLWISLSYVFINILVDLVYSWVDPRIRLDG